MQRPSPVWSGCPATWLTASPPPTPPRPRTATRTAATVTVTPDQDSQAVSGGNPRQMDVTITAPVNTFFMRMFGITKIQATRTSKAVYVLPVPMGSPLNYYGDFGPIYRTGNQRSPRTTTPGRSRPRSTPTGNLNQWTNGPPGFATRRPVRDRAPRAGTMQGYYDYSYTFPNNTTILGIQVDLDRQGPAAPRCTLNVSLSQNGGGSFTTSNDRRRR